MAHCIGLMSGTSMDGIDGVLVRWPSEASGGIEVLSHRQCAMPAALRQTLIALNSPGPNELHRAALAANALAEGYAEVTAQLLADAGIAARQVRVIGAHGQTVRHRPGEFDGRGYTLQLFNGALLAELSGIDVVCDLRSRDVAAGGQGAPLVPAFHAALWARAGVATAVLNLGGIANLSLLHADGRIGGFDCGPGNVLMDRWCERHQGRPFDTDGHWAAGGQVDANLLARLLSNPFFERPPPKSTGRDLFDAAWLDQILAATDIGTVSPRDVQCTLAEMTAMAAAQALLRHAPTTRHLLVCGGGAFNAHLMRRLAALLPDMNVRSTSLEGLPPQQVEAAAFAWLAHAFVERQPGNRPEVTGAAGPRILGALYPAR